MATSGSYDFGLTAAQLVARVAKNLSILGAGATINANDQTDLLETLNVVAKELQGTSDMAPGMKVWTRQRVTVFLAKGQQTYQIGPASGDAKASTQYGRTTLSSAAVATDTVLNITSNVDSLTYPGTTVTMTNADTIGIQLDDGTIQWTTISGTPSVTATISAGGGLTGAAAAGNYVYWYTSKAQRFPICESAVLRNSDRNDMPLSVYRTVEEYELGVVDKYADGSPTAILIEPKRITTQVTLDTQPDDVTDVIVLTVLYPAEDYDATTNDIAFPQEYLGYLEWEVTLRSCPMYGKKWTQEMQLNYQNSKTRAMNLNPEVSSAYFAPGGCE